MTRPLNGKTALVTGGSKGIGRAIAERLARDGATVALTYNASKSGADEAVAAIEKAGGTAFAIQADLVDPATVPALFDRLDDEFTKRTGSKALDILVNNAGNSGYVGFKDATPDLGLVEAVDRLGQGVVIAVTNATDGGLDAGLSQTFGVPSIRNQPLYKEAPRWG